MKKIVLARVDDRLIHTEILTLWVPGKYVQTESLLLMT